MIDPVAFERVRDTNYVKMKTLFKRNRSEGTETRGVKAYNRTFIQGPLPPRKGGRGGKMGKPRNNFI